MRRQSPERGSIVLFVLFVCLAVAAIVQILTTIVLCADRALSAEGEGRALMEQRDEALAVLRTHLLSDWKAVPWATMPGEPEVEVTAGDLPDGGGWALSASARQVSGVSPIVVSAWLERGRDGVDLPLAAIVAARATWAPERTAPWAVMDDTSADFSDETRAAAGPLVRLQTVPDGPLLGEGLTVGPMATVWRLDDGWLSFFQGVATGENGQEPAETGGGGAAEMGPGAGVCCLSGEPGTIVELPQEWGASPGGPGLLVVTGGAGLDASGRGDVTGVIVVDGGDVLLEGTRVRGALFATGAVDFGSSGQVTFTRSTLRWATDRSLVRGRLVPGTRAETIE